MQFRPFVQEELLFSSTVTAQHRNISLAGVTILWRILGKRSQIGELEKYVRMTLPI